MGIFSRETENPVRERVTELAQRVEDLERHSKALELEWEEMYDKFRRLLARISKRQDALDSAEKGAGSGESADPRQLPLVSEDRQSRLNQMIREQRGRGALPTVGNGTG